MKRFFLFSLSTAILLFCSICSSSLSADFSVGRSQPTGSDVILEAMGRGAAKGMQDSYEEARRTRAQEEMRRVQQQADEMHARNIQNKKEKNALICKENKKQPDSAKRVN